MIRQGRTARGASLATVAVAVTMTVAILAGAMGGAAQARPFDEGMAAAESGDFATALRIWAPLARQGHPNAQFNLAQMYARGDGVPQDFVKAAHWYRLVANQGFPEARFRLGVFFERGVGVPVDFLCAYMWHSLAATAGWQPAEAHLEALAPTMTTGRVLWAQKMARDFKPDYPYCPDAPGLLDAAWME